MSTFLLSYLPTFTTSCPRISMIITKTLKKKELCKNTVVKEFLTTAR